MNLKQLKVAGFKSFVDPTVVHFPSQLVGVVGPNGCGKSNIIDAVRWVLGESSAKNLRGESMTDVIFNGSSNRKPVGQASVELVFDNSLGRLTGPFASYGEIAVKRIVTRDGDSSYYLNGSRCRRKDVTDIFLGTGAGAKGYSIIGQGTISRLIEAKPEDLRVFLEEAAGVSKYKERRRETLLRITQTKDNLIRIADIRDELDKQLQRLERQAKAAERYTQLKQEEHQCRADIWALKWRDLTTQQKAKQTDLQDLAVQFEQYQSLLTHSQTERAALNEDMFEANELMQQIQVHFYQLGTEIARLEETIQQQIREKNRLEQDKLQLQADWQQIRGQLSQDKEALQESQLKAQDLKEKVIHLQQELNKKEEHFRLDNARQQEQETLWLEAQSKVSHLKNESHIVRVNGQHAKQKQQDIILRLEKLQKEQSTISLEDHQKEQTNLLAQQVLLETQQNEARENFQIANERCVNLRNQLKQIEQQQHQLQDEFYNLNSQYAALMAAQKAAKQSHNATKNDISAWANKSRLMDILQVEPEWQKACDRILHDELHAYVLDKFSDAWTQWDLCLEQGQSIVTLDKSQPEARAYPSLADKIKGPVPVTAKSLRFIYTANSLDEAISWLPNLAAQESVLTKEGFWLGNGWIKLVNAEAQDDIGLLARQQQINDLTLTVEALHQEIEILRLQRDELHSKLQQELVETEHLQQSLNLINESVRDHDNTFLRNQQSIIQAEKRQINLVEDINELQNTLEELRLELLQNKERAQLLDEQIEQALVQQETLNKTKQDYKLQQDDLNNLMIEARHILHQSELDCDREVNKVQQLNERIVREQDRLDTLQERLEQINLLSLQTQNPENNLQDQLAHLLLKHGEVEDQLTQSKERLSQYRITQDALEKTIFNQDLGVKTIQEAIAESRMQEQALAVKAGAMQDALNDMQLIAQQVLEHLSEEVSPMQKEDELIQLTEKIKRLGAINLAAIEEFATEHQRKIYLDEQHHDLSQALAILETAIDKMDNETRERLKNTFEEVNTSFKALFPRLFGGGRAQLELTCDNLLEAGIVVMAQPPGKRNSTIHLLSGGEKAMTAVALVFAIFQLNPSPFCMLDEVDAPLDDVNVGRFCSLVKEMSQFVQFLFITHNKVTMELAEHLMGVTMREPGVSRLVAVDVKEALTME